MNTTKQRQQYQALKAAGRFNGTIKAALALREQREKNDDQPVTIGRYATEASARLARRSAQTVVPLGTVDVLTRIKERYARLREWSLGQKAGAIGSAWEFREIGSNWNWSKRSTFQRGIVVQSYATCTDFRVCEFHLDGQTHTIYAPRGWRWDVDANGLRLRMCSNAKIDYHPTASELIGNVRELPKLAHALAAKRREQAARTAKEQRIIREADQNGLLVCLQDSIRAGNCEAGSINWATKHGFDPRRHYSPSELLAVANGDTNRVAIVVLTAARRHMREMAAGICEVADHGSAWTRKN